MKLETRRKKRLLWGAALLCLTFVVVSFLDFDAESLKERLIAEAWAQKARTLEINGGLRLKILPRIAVEIRDAKLSGPRGEGEFLRVGQLRGALEILPLLMGKITVNRLEMRDFSLVAERYSDGSSNFDDLLAQNEEKKQDAMDFEIGKAILLNGRLSWLDATSGQQFSLEDVYLRSDTLGAKAYGQLEMSGKAALSPSNAVSFTLDSHYRIDGDAHSLQLDMPRLNLKTPGTDKLRLELTARRLAANWNTPTFSIVALKLEGQHEEKGAENLSATLKLEKLDWRKDSGELQDGTFQLQWAREGDTGQGKHEKSFFSLNAKLPMLENKEGNWQGDALTGDFQGKLQGSALEGQIRLPVFIRAREGGASLEMDAMAITAEASGGGLKEALDLRFQGNTTVALAGGDGVVSSGKWLLSQADSRLDLEWRVTRPTRLDFQANLNHLDIDRYWKPEATKPEVTEKSPQKATQETIQTEQEDSAPSPVVSNANANANANPNATTNPFPGGLDGVLNIGALKIGGVQLEKLESRIEWVNGQVEINTHNAPPTEKPVKKPGEQQGKSKAGRAKTPAANSADRAIDNPAGKS